MVGDTRWRAGIKSASSVSMCPRSPTRIRSRGSSSRPIVCLESREHALEERLESLVVGEELISIGMNISVTWACMPWGRATSVPRRGPGLRSIRPLPSDPDPTGLPHVTRDFVDAQSGGTESVRGRAQSQSQPSLRCVPIGTLGASSSPKTIVRHESSAWIAKSYGATQGMTRFVERRDRPMTNLQLTFRNLARSEAVAAHAERQAEKLLTFCHRITSCRVAIEAPHRHHHGGPYRVRIDLALPGHEIAVTNSPTSASSSDIHSAIDAASSKRNAG